MAKKKSISGLRNGRDSKSKRLGFKISSKQLIKPGNIILRQKGSKFMPGKNTCMGKDYTILSLIYGKIEFIKKYNNIYINVI